MGTKSRKTYTAKFKQDAVNHYNSSGKSIVKVADELQISRTSLNNQIQSAKKNDYKVTHRGSSNYALMKPKRLHNLKKELRDAQAQ